MQLNEHVTSDLNEATLLRYYEHKLEFIDKSDYRAKFHFARREDTDDILKSYRERVLQVEPYAYSLCLREMKDRLYNG